MVSLSTFGFGKNKEFGMNSCYDSGEYVQYPKYDKKDINMIGFITVVNQDTVIYLGTVLDERNENNYFVGISNSEHYRFLREADMLREVLPEMVGMLDTELVESMKECTNKAQKFLADKVLDDENNRPPKLDNHRDLLVTFLNGLSNNPNNIIGYKG